MYEVAVQHPAIEERRYICADLAELRTLVWGVAQAQGNPIAADDGDEMLAEVANARRRADFFDFGLLRVEQCSVRIELAEESDCDGHDSVYAALGESQYCDGTCRPGVRFKRAALHDLTAALESAEAEAAGECDGCGLEVDQRCVGCGRCNCDQHDGCVRPSVLQP
ncbi:hypothetical protein OG216_19540 [Streptomycetaceae bacterium NBC_01309]